MGAIAAEPRTGPVPVEVFMDYHCPYSHRVICWLDDLGPDLAEVRFRFFALEQVNRDPDASAWRIWEQPLDYEHYQERPDRRALAAFLATAAVEAAFPADPGVSRRFRRAVYAARFEGHLDISDLAVLDDAGVAAGLPGGWIAAALADATLTSEGRSRIAADWASARSPYLVFGVPTLLLADGAPVYLRLTAPIPPADGPAFLAAFLAFRRAAPGVLEFKQPEPSGPS